MASFKVELGCDFNSSSQPSISVERDIRSYIRGRSIEEEVFETPDLRGKKWLERGTLSVRSFVRSTLSVCMYCFGLSLCRERERSGLK